MEVKVSDFDSIKPLYKNAMIFGIAPVKSKWQWIYSIFMLIILNLLAVNTIRLLIGVDASHRFSQPTGTVTHVLSVLGLMIFINLTLLKFSLWHKAEYFKFLNFFADFPIYESRRVWFHILLLNLFYCFYIYRYYMFFSMMNILSFFNYFLIIFYLNYVLLLSMLLIVSYIVSINSRFRSLIKELKEVRSTDKQKLLVFVVDDIKKVAKPDGSKVKKIRRSFIYLDETVKRFNQLFGGQILLLCVSIFNAFLETFNSSITTFADIDNSKTQEEADAFMYMFYTYIIGLIPVAANHAIPHLKRSRILVKMEVKVSDFESVRPLYQISMVLGIAPFEAKWHNIYLAFMLISLNSLLVYTIQFHFRETFTHKFMVSAEKVINLFHIFSLTIYINLTLLKFSLWHKAMYYEFLNFFTEFPFSASRHIWIQLFLLHLFYGIYIYRYYMYFSMLNNIKYFYSSFVFCYLSYLLCLSMLLIFNYIVSINSRLRKLVKELKEIKSSAKQKLLVFVMDDIRKVVKPDGYKVKLIRRSYVFMEETVKKFNQLFGCQILFLCVVIFNACLMICNASFTIFSLISISKTQEEADIHLYLYYTYIIGMIPLAVMGIVVAVTCDKTTKEAQKTATVCYTLLLDVPAVSNNLQDRILREELILLAQQATHHCPYFSAAGFFRVDYTMLFGLLATVTSYVIVLIQINK